MYVYGCGALVAVHSELKIRMAACNALQYNKMYTKQRPAMQRTAIQQNVYDATTAIQRTAIQRNVHEAAHGIQYNNQYSTLCNTSWLCAIQYNTACAVQQPV